jgi:hypothetical protein
MIYKIILSLLYILRRGKVYSVFLAYIFDLVPSSSQTNDCRVEFGQVFGTHAWSVTSWVAGYEDREEWREGGLGFFGGEDGRSVDEVDHLSHFVEFFGADVWTVGKAKINLSPLVSFTISHP